MKIKDVKELSENLLKRLSLCVTSLHKGSPRKAGRQQKAALNDGSHQKHPKRGGAALHSVRKYTIFL